MQDWPFEQTAAHPAATAQVRADSACSTVTFRHSSMVGPPTRSNWQVSRAGRRSTAPARLVALFLVCGRSVDGIHAQWREPLSQCRAHVALGIAFDHP
jgi:hypothetical protein